MQLSVICHPHLGLRVGLSGSLESGTDASLVFLFFFFLYEGKILNYTFFFFIVHL